MPISKATTLVGRDDFLFLADDSNNLFDQHLGKMRLSDEWLATAVDLRLERKDCIEKWGGEYLHVLAPNKETVLEDLLPEGLVYEMYGDAPVHQYLRKYPACTSFTNFYPDTLRALPPEAAFRRDDTHWTALGACIYLARVFSEYLSLQGLVRFLLGPMNKVLQYRLGDLGRKLVGSSPIPNIVMTPKLPSATLIYGNNFINRNRVHLYQNEEAPDSRLVIIAHDSFGDSFLSIVPALFARVLFIHTADFDASLVDSLKPDIYIDIQVERFFPRMPKNGIDFANAMYTLAKARGHDFEIEDYQNKISVIAESRVNQHIKLK